MPERATVLIVDDEPVVREAAAKALSREGWRVEVATDGGSALPLFESAEVQIILCDLMLPGTSGFELLQANRRVRPSRPFVLITGFGTLEKTLEAFRAGAFDFIPKPFDAAELVGVVDRAGRFATRSVEGAGAGRRLESPSGTSRSETFHLGRHSWVRLDRDGVATIGLGETFAGTVEGVDRVELPSPGEEARQARRIARLLCGDQAIHRVWTPLSGRIIALNDELRAKPGLLESQEPSLSWLARLLPSSREREVAQLLREGEGTNDDRELERGEGFSWSLRSS